jgi:hypothetical protein
MIFADTIKLCKILLTHPALRVAVISSAALCVVFVRLFPQEPLSEADFVALLIVVLAALWLLGQFRRLLLSCGVARLSRSFREFLAQGR